MQKVYFIFFLVFIYSSHLFSQINLPVKRTANALRINNAPKIDGKLDDDCWKLAKINNGFTQSEPNPRKPANQDADVKIIYDDKAIYIGAVIHVQSPDSIFKQITIRDNNENADFFGIVLDT